MAKAIPAHTCIRNGGKTGRPWRGSCKDYIAVPVIDPRLNGETVCLRPRSANGKRKLEMLRTVTGMLPVIRHGWGRKAVNREDAL